MKTRNWTISDVFSLIAIVLSVIFSALTLVLNSREDPLVMPYGHIIDDRRLVLDFNNFSDMNLYEVSILISGFDSQLNAIPSFRFQDKFMFAVSSKSAFNYGFNLGKWAARDFYFRVRFKGKSYSRFPTFPQRTFEQKIWYSALIQPAEGDSVQMLLLTTHRDVIDSLETKFKLILDREEKNIDHGFWN